MSNKKKVADLLQENSGDGWFQDTIVAHAPTIMGIFANLVVIFADYRAYDVVYQLTNSWWKAASASLACAIPFVLWEIGWQYNKTTENWRTASLVMAALAFATSLFLGVADFLGFQGAWADWLLGGVVIVTGIHTVVGFLYYYNDPDVARRRHKAQTLATMLDQEENAAVAEQLLKSGSDLLAIINGMQNRYDPEDVEMVMNILRGKKKGKPTEQRGSVSFKGSQNNSSTSTASDTQRDSGASGGESHTERRPETNFSLSDVLSKMGISRQQAELKYAGLRYSDFAGDCSKAFGSTHIDGPNMKKAFYELIPNPTPAEPSNGRR